MSRGYPGMREKSYLLDISFFAPSIPGGTMSDAVQPYRDPDATPVGHAGTRVEIQERPAWAISGWAGVLVVAICIAAAILLAESSTPAAAVAPVVLAVLILSSLVIIQP